MEDLYREVIIDRYKNPIYKGSIDQPDIVFEDDNPLCGDHIRIELAVDSNGKVSQAAFDGHGCAISQASADLLLENVLGKSIEEIKQITKDDLLGILGLQLGPVRLKCALLSLKVLKAGVYGLGEASDDLVE